MVTKLDPPVASGDWHDRPLRWRASIGDATQCFATKRDALKWASLCRRYGAREATVRFARWALES